MQAVNSEAARADWTRPEGRQDDDQVAADNRGLEWRSWLVRGAVALAVGVLAALFPFGAWLSLTVLVAGYALADGVLALADAGRRRRKKRPPRWGLMFRGLTGLLVGVAFLFAPFLTMVSVGIVAAVLLAFWAVMIGALELTAAIRHRKETKGEWLLMLYGVITIAAGLALLLMLVLAPQWTILSLTAVVGIYAVLSGIVLIVHGLGLWRLERQAMRGEAA